MKNIDKLQKLSQQIQTVVLGKPKVVRQVLLVLLAKGHVLLEDVPGVGKTLLSRSLAASVHGDFSRIQLTPDLLPSDILGVSVYDSKSAKFTFNRGPIFANFILADEINRTTPRTQAALLEAMNEHQVTTDGVTYALGPVFMVIATQNPYEFEGTYFLPENQLDRFTMKIGMGHPDMQTEKQILMTQPASTKLGNLAPVMSVEEIVELQDLVNTIKIDDAIVDYILQIAQATRLSPDLWIGLSSRATLAMMQVARANALLEGRDYVVPDDVKNYASDICSHRLCAKTYTHDGATNAAKTVFDSILETVDVPK